MSSRRTPRPSTGLSEARHRTDHGPVHRADPACLKFPGATDLATWNAHRDAGYRTYTVGNPPAWSAFFLERRAAELASREFGDSYCQWDGKTGHMVTVPEREAEAR